MTSTPTPRTDAFAFIPLEAPTWSTRERRHAEWLLFARQLERELAQVREERDRARRGREELDCRFAGPFAELSGSHCPLNRRCQRCQLEAVTEERNQALAALRWFEKYGCCGIVVEIPAELRPILKLADEAKK